jgi:hypothetical protein
MAKKIIYQIDSVTVSIIPTLPPKLRITAKGKVSSTGWSAPGLVKYIYVHQPFDGIQDFSFVAEPPAGIYAPVLKPISITTDVALQPWMKGVRIHGTSNFKVARFRYTAPSNTAKAAAKKPAAKKPAAKKAAAKKSK